MKTFFSVLRYQVAHRLPCPLLILLCSLLIWQIAALFLQEESAPFSQAGTPVLGQPPFKPVSAITLTTTKAKLQFPIFGRELRFPGIGFDFVGATGEKNPTLYVFPGTVRITLTNGDGFTHFLAIPDLHLSSAVVDEQGEHTGIEFTALPGKTYTYLCPVRLHRETGMIGNILVLDR